MAATATPLAIVSSIVFVGSVAVVGARWRTRDVQVRHRVEWLAAAGVAVAGASAAGAVLWAVVGWPANLWSGVLLALAAVPAAMVAGRTDALRRFGPAVLVRTLVITGVTVSSMAIYLVVVVGFGGNPNDEDRSVVALSLLAAVIMAVTSVPIGRRLADWARWRVYRGGRAPREALRAFGGHMTRSVPMGELLLQLTEVLKTSLSASAVEVWTAEGSGGSDVLERVVSLPERGPASLRLDEREQTALARSKAQGRTWLTVWLPGLLEGRPADLLVRTVSVAHLGALLGLIVLERPAGSDPFSEEDDAELIDLARQLGLALHNLGLDSALRASLHELEQRNADLQASRARLVVASDASRRAIERDLHDGAQQHLVAMAVRVGMLKDELPPDGPAAAVVDALYADVKATLAELRVLAQGIYPQVLRDRGLADALHAVAVRSPVPTSVVIDDPEGRRQVGDVEAAVYFCCLEAVQNACKHAGDGVRIEIELVVAPDHLRFGVHDDGVGFDTSVHPVEGTGLVNMADRLGAVGGRVEVASASGCGTQVSGWLPLPAGTVPGAAVAR